TRSIVEPAGALAVAGVKQYVAAKKTKGETYAAILCGANMNFDRLRFVAERAEVGEEREALFAVTIPEERGSFKRFCELIGALPGGARNVTEFNYRISDSVQAHVFVGLTTHGKGESVKIAANFTRHGFDALDLTHDELAKEHIRHMVGGHSALARDERLLRFVFPERPGALAVAAIKQYVARNRTKGETYAAILCGANMNFDRLRFVAERAEVGEEREALFAVTIPEERGSFKRFCALIGDLPGGPRNVTEFNYRINDASQAHVFVGLTTHGKGESTKIAANFSRHGFQALDLTHDDLAKEHVRHMVGGHSALARDERLLRFVFPERPGALMKFLSHMRPGWNITLFHYRNQGADYGRILVGLQVPQADSKVFQAFLDTLGYPHVEETANPVYRLFLRS
ncbi:MAG: hypothetical protein ABIT82_10515, partial [Ramlibacter sp.]